jgi:hypothetical protein
MGRLAVVCAVLAGSAGTASAQLDPLLFLKGTRPNVLVVMDTTERMQRDADETYSDPGIYTKTNAGWEASIGVTAATTATNYRRRFLRLTRTDGGAGRYSTTSIQTVGDLSPDYASFGGKARLVVARNSVARAIQLNQRSIRFGLLKTRQSNPRIGSAGAVGSVRSDDPNQLSPAEMPGGTWNITTGLVDQPDGSLGTPAGPVVPADAANANSAILSILSKDPNQAGALIPAGGDTRTTIDAPVDHMIEDARLEVARLILADSLFDKTCRNTAVVLIVGGAEGQSAPGADPVSRAAQFLTNLSGRRAPIYVIGVAPPAGDAAQLRAIAAGSGGQYFEVTKAMIDAVPAGSPVPEFVRAVNTAVQHTVAAFGDFNTAPTAQLPYGPSTEYQGTSPIVGTVELANSVDINGNPLVNSVIAEKNGNLIPQRSNVMLTTGVATPGPITTPGLPGRLRAFRVHRPVPDTTKSGGYTFVGDGTALWLARPPTSTEGIRNIYTVLPSGAAVPFTLDNATRLQPYLNDPDARGLIGYVRGLPLGAFLDSTPAILAAPSLDPPPDSEYPAFVEMCRKRRTLVFIGGNDGMLHAIDGRTGVEVWAFIPSNLLPKLRALREGQGLDQVPLFVDGSPKLADVKIGGQWRTYLVFGEGPGGTFYQAMDVTMADLGDNVPPDSSDVSALLAYFSNPSRIAFKWSFPSYAHFNYTLSTSATPHGDLDKDLASAIEKSVGQTWSSPALGQVKNASGSWVALVGSGFLPYSQQRQANRADTAAGTTFYVIDVATGTVLDSRNVGNDGTAETADNCAVSGNCSRQKNALQSDPVATGPPASRFIDTVYVGDLDGRLWRFGLGLDVGHAAIINTGPTKLYDAGASQPLFSSLALVNASPTQQYVFFASGSDLLPSAGVSQAFNLYGVLDTGGVGAQKFVQALEQSETNGDEKVSAHPTVAGDVVFFTTTTFSTTLRCTAPDATVYAFKVMGGPAYDNTGDNKVGNEDTPKVKTFSATGRATAPFVADQHLAVVVGGKVEVFGDPQGFNNGVGQTGVRILSWREIR